MANENEETNMSHPANENSVKKKVAGEKLRGAAKMEHIPVKIINDGNLLRKPDWIRVRIPASPKVARIKEILRKNNLSSVCEEASCPNLGECFHGGTATFMIMGAICTRRCPFCDVAHGKPLALDEGEPKHLASAIQEMGLNYVVVTSVDRDDLRDGGAAHFVDCIKNIRELSPGITIEVLVPDFRGRMDIALDILTQVPPDIFNHNLETVPSLYRQVRPGANYNWSLMLLKKFKERVPQVPTKSGLMVGLGETKDELVQVLHDMRAHNIDMITIGQYLQPSRDHLPVIEFITPAQFVEYEGIAKELGFEKVASGPLVRSSYHADQQAKGDIIR
jgi:lipoic acid synthetase